jgi:hypothetical protein
MDNLDYSAQETLRLYNETLMKLVRKSICDMRKDNLTTFVIYKKEYVDDSKVIDICTELGYIVTQDENEYLDFSCPCEATKKSPRFGKNNGGIRPVTAPGLNPEVSKMYNESSDNGVFLTSVETKATIVPKPGNDKKPKEKK